MRVVVDCLKRRPIGQHAGDNPLRASIIDFPLRMAAPDRLLDIGRIQPPLSEARARVLGPDEAVNLHDPSLSRVTNGVHSTGALSLAAVVAAARTQTLPRGRLFGLLRDVLLRDRGE